MPPETESSPPRQSASGRCQRTALASGAAVFVLGLCVLIGWMCNFQPLMTLLPGLVTMKPNTAVALCLAGLSLFLFARPTGARDGRSVAAATTLAALSAALGALALAEYAFQLNLGIDELLWRRTPWSASPPGGWRRSAPSTSSAWGSR